MKKSSVLSSPTPRSERMNPLLKPFDTPLESVPFGQFDLADIREAIVEGIRQEDKEINRITANKEDPTFSNTLLAMQQTGEILDRALSIVGCLLGNASTPQLESLVQEMTPMISEHEANIDFNKDLFDRIKTIYTQSAAAPAEQRLQKEEQVLLDKVYEAFKRRGVDLPANKQQQLRQISVEASKSALQFSQNLLQETNRFFLLITDKRELKGLTAEQLDRAAHTARERGKKGWAFTLQAPSYTPLMSHCANRSLRRKVWMAYNHLCCHGGRYDNRALVKRLVNYRLERAQLLGYDCYADLALQERMAGSKERVADFLDQLIDRYKPQALKDRKELIDFVHTVEGKDFEMRPWDTAYYSHRLYVKKYDFDPEVLRPYFQLSNVIQGVFGLATRLYGITFKENPTIPVYDKDVKVYEVYDKDSSYLALLYADFFPRDNKKSGAWTSSLREQHFDEKGQDVRPHATITMNFTKPTSSKPALLSLSEVSTLLHEFGHALHEIFSKVRFEALSGTNVYWDFVELPSQMMENFATERDFLRTFAFHYKTGEVIPDELIDKIKASHTFGAAGSCMRQVSLGLLDMAYYTLTKPLEKDVIAFEKQAWSKAVLKSNRLKVCMTTQFQHIMTGGYAAGYYSYKWAEVLDADAFSLFKQEGIFCREVAGRFRHCILEKGGTEDPNKLYRDFRGQEPTPEAMLRRDGIL